MINPPKSTKSPSVSTLVLDNWNRGRVSVFDENRGLINGLDESLNVWLTQDGVAEPRPGLKLYGVQPENEIIGITEVVSVENGWPVNYLLSVQRDSKAQKAYVYYAKDGDRWRKAEGIEYTGDAIDAEYNFCQTDQKCLIFNGINKTHFFDFSTKTVKKFEKLTQPTDLKITKTGLSEGGVALRYGITAQSYGETMPVYFTTQKVDRERNNWEAGKQTVTLEWKCNDPNVQRFIIYVGNEVGKEQYLADVANDGSGSFKFTDTGVLFAQPGTTAPEADTSEGIVGRRGTNINGTVYVLGDIKNPWRIYYDGGTPKTALNFSYSGGGWIDVAPGGKDLPNAVVDFRTGKGDPVPTIFLQGTNGFGSMKHLLSDTIEIGGVPIPSIKVQDANGREGTDAPNAILKYQESLHYLSKNGVFTTGTQPNIQSILSTTKSSATISRDFEKLNTKNLSKASGIVHDGKLIWALPVGTKENNQIWLQDLDRGGAWMLPWMIPAKFLLHYGSNDGKTHQLAIVNNKVCEFDYDAMAIDVNKTFETKVKTSKVYFSKQNDYSRVLTVSVDLINPVGDITVAVRGFTRRREIQKVIRKKFRDQTKILGWGDKFSFSSLKDLGWGKTRPFSQEKTTETKNIVLKINKDLKWVSVEISSQGAIRYGVHKIRVRHVPIGYLPEKGVGDE